MRRFFLISLLLTTQVTLADAGLGQKQQAKCEQGPTGSRNWELVESDYVYFDYVLCPADVEPPSPRVRVWITTRGYGIAVEKWRQDGDGADNVSVFDGKKRVYTLYRDLDAVPLKMLKAERRSGIPADLSRQPFLAEGLNLIPLQNLTPDSAERAKKAMRDADALIKQARAKMILLHETPRIAAVVKSLLDAPLKAQE